MQMWVEEVARIEGVPKPFIDDDTIADNGELMYLIDKKVMSNKVPNLEKNAIPRIYQAKR